MSGSGSNGTTGAGGGGGGGAGGNGGAGGVDCLNIFERTTLASSIQPYSPNFAPIRNSSCSSSRHKDRSLLLQTRER